MTSKYCLFTQTLVAIVFATLAPVDHCQDTNLFQKTTLALSDTTDPTILIAAHRGGYINDKQDEAPENSVENIDVAITKGFHVYETDIRQTADGVFVVVHDESLERETNGTGPVEKLNFEKVAKLKKKFRDGSLSNFGVASFESILLAGKNRIYFKPDLKPGVIDSFDKLARLIHKHEMAGQVFLRTEYKHLWKIEKLFADGTPRVEVMFKVNDAAQVKKVHERCEPKTIQINVRKNEKLSEEQIEAIKTAIELGMIVETHVYNDEEQIEQLIKSGVRMFHTNKPDATLKFLSDRAAKASSKPATR